MERPTKTQVFHWHADRQRVYARMHREMEIDEDFLLGTSVYGEAYGGNDRISRYLRRGFPADYRFTIPPIAKDAVDIGINNILVGETATVKVSLPLTSRRSDQKLQDDAKDLEDTYQDLLYYLDTYSQEPFLRACVTWGLALGMAAFKYPLAWRRWPEYPLGELSGGGRRKPANAKQRDEVARYQRKWQQAQPIAMQALHPLTLFPDPYHDPSEDYIERVTVRREAFTDYEFDGAKEGDAVATYYCSPEWYGVWLDDQPLLGAKEHAVDGIAPNPTGICWYGHVWAGFGTKDKKGAFEYLGKGILRDGRDIIVAYLRARNRLMAVGALYSFPPIDVDAPTKQQATEEGSEFSLTPGAIWPHSTGVHAKIVDMGNISPFIIEEYNQAKAELEVHFGPDILRGVRSPGETAAGQRSRTSMALAPYKVLRQNLQQLVASALMNITHMVKVELRQPMNIIGRSTTRVLDPKNIPDDHMATVNFAPPTDEEEAQELEQKNQKMQLGVMSQERYLESEKLDDPDEERARLLADEITKTPAYLQVLTDAATQQLQQALGLPPPAQPAAPPQPDQGFQQPEAQPGGFPLPGEQPMPPALGSPADMARQNGASRAQIPQLVGGP